MAERKVRKPHHLDNNAYRGQIRVAVTLCIEKGVPVFGDAQTVEACVELLRSAVVQNGCCVPVYCFMPEHAHIIFVGLTETSDVWRAVLSFKQQTGYCFRNNNRSRWQKNFYDHIIRKSQDLG